MKISNCDSTLKMIQCCSDTVIFGIMIYDAVCVQMVYNESLHSAEYRMWPKLYNGVASYLVTKGGTIKRCLTDISLFDALRHLQEKIKHSSIDYDDDKLIGYRVQWKLNWGGHKNALCFYFKENHCSVKVDYKEENTDISIPNLEKASPLNGMAAFTKPDLVVPGFVDGEESKILLRRITP